MCGPGMEMIELIEMYEEENKMKEVISSIRSMIAESLNPYNDGYVQKGYRDELKKIYYLIQKELDLQYTPVDGLEVGSPEDYEQ